MAVAWRAARPALVVARAAVPVINAEAERRRGQRPAPEQLIAADGWFTLLGFGFGLLAAVLVWLLLRRDRGPALLLGGGLRRPRPPRWSPGRWAA